MADGGPWWTPAARTHTHTYPTRVFFWAHPAILIPGLQFPSHGRQSVPALSNRHQLRAINNILFFSGVLEKPLEKKSGRNYGPPGTKKLIYFIDDMNMPEVDKYGTVAPHTLIRQHMDHRHW